MQNTSHLAWFLGTVPNVSIATSSPPSRASPSPKGLMSSEGVTSNEDGFLEDGRGGTPNLDDGLRGSSVRPSEIQLIDRIDMAQLEGRLPYSSSETAINPRSGAVTSPCKLVSLSLTKHGLKISDAHTEEVIDRLPLHALCQSVVYDDGEGHSNVAIKVGGQMNMSKNLYTCYVFQTRNEEEAVRISRNLEEIFESALSVQ